MVTKFSLEVVTERVDYASYAQAYVSDAFNELVKRANKLRERTLIEAEMLPDGRQKKRVRIVPEVQLPASLRKLLADHTLWYDEVTIYDDAARTAALTIESLAGDRVRVSGLARCIERDGGVVLCFDGEIDVRLLGLGTLIERFVVGEVERRYREVGALLQQHVDSARTRDATCSAER